MKDDQDQKHQKGKPDENQADGEQGDEDRLESDLAIGIDPRGGYREDEGNDAKKKEAQKEAEGE